MTNPDDRGYTAEHNWILMEDEQSAAVGITWFAQDQLGEITYVDLPEVGERLEAGETYGVVESMKTTSELYAPVSGAVVSVNEALMEEPTLVNDDSYGAGWLLKIHPDSPSDITALLTAEHYTSRVGA